MEIISKIYSVNIDRFDEDSRCLKIVSKPMNNYLFINNIHDNIQI